MGSGAGNIYEGTWGSAGSRALRSAAELVVGYAAERVADAALQVAGDTPPDEIELPSARDVAVDLALDALSLAAPEGRAFSAALGLAKRSGRAAPAAKAVAREKIDLPPNEAQLKHIFRKFDHGLAGTDEEKGKVLKVARETGTELGPDAVGAVWYEEILDDGSQFWVKVWNGIVSDAGVNVEPRPWDSKSGFNDANARKAKR